GRWRQRSGCWRHYSSRRRRAHRERRRVHVALQELRPAGSEQRQFEDVRTAGAGRDGPGHRVGDRLAGGEGLVIPELLADLGAGRIVDLEVDQDGSRRGTADGAGGRDGVAWRDRGWALSG